MDEDTDLYDLGGEGGKFAASSADDADDEELNGFENPSSATQALSAQKSILSPPQKSSAASSKAPTKGNAASKSNASKSNASKSNASKSSAPAGYSAPAFAATDDHEDEDEMYDLGLLFFKKA